MRCLDGAMSCLTCFRWLGRSQDSTGLDVLMTMVRRGTTSHASAAQPTPGTVATSATAISPDDGATPNSATLPAIVWIVATVSGPWRGT